jgi:hypothetical protein
MTDEDPHVASALIARQLATMAVVPTGRAIPASPNISLASPL